MSSIIIKDFIIIITKDIINFIFANPIMGRRKIDHLVIMRVIIFVVIVIIIVVFIIIIKHPNLHPYQTNLKLIITFFQQIAIELIALEALQFQTSLTNLFIKALEAKVVEMATKLMAQVLIIELWLIRN